MLLGCLIGFCGTANSSKLIHAWVCIPSRAVAISHCWTKGEIPGERGQGRALGSGVRCALGRGVPSSPAAVLSGVGTKPAVLEEMISGLSKANANLNWLLGLKLRQQWDRSPGWWVKTLPLTGSLSQEPHQPQPHACGDAFLVNGAVFPACCWPQAPAPREGCGHSTWKQELDPSSACLNVFGLPTPVGEWWRKGREEPVWWERGAGGG